MDESELEGNIDGVKIKIILNFSNRFSSIDVDDVTYKTNYNNDFGHLVVLDEKTHEMKFYQTFGYTAWNEDIKELFMGEKFKEKIEGKNTMDVIGTHIFEYHQKSDIILDLVEGKRTYSGKLARINGVSVLCGVKPIIRDNKKTGSLLIVENISKMKNIKNQRDYAFKELESAKAELDDKKIYNKLFPRIVGSSDNAMKTKKLAYRASKSNSTVLILGESGTGKTILAKSIHEASERKCNPLIQVNCNSIPESLLESELFGYEKGAFTGASAKGKKGYFEMADKGTIFLDEIGDISKNMQVKLLHVIQSKSFYKVGGNDEINVDVRIIVATNRNLE